MLKRLHIYCKERYPLIPRLLLGFIVFCEIYFIILMNSGITDFQFGIQECIGGFTVFAFLLWLRIADDLKDDETDKVLFPDRPLASGRVHKKDVVIFCALVQAAAVVLHILFMPPRSWIFFGILYVYGFLMSKWFFQKSKIQPSLPLALVTHNPVQAFVNLYIIAFTCIKYPAVKPFSLYTILALFTLYFPALIWEISRKIRAPKDETAYVTYSKLFGYKKATRFVLLITWVDILTNLLLVRNLNRISVVVLLLLVSWMTWKFAQFIRDPERFTLVKKVELYTYLQETTMLLTVAAFLIWGRI